jgi:hypothetical protein
MVGARVRSYYVEWVVRSGFADLDSLFTLLWRGINSRVSNMSSSS